MFKIFKSKLSDEELFQALKKDGIAVTEKDIQKARENDTETLYELGNEYYEKEKYRKAFAWFHKAALLYHGEAQAIVGWMYLKGQGVSEDYKQAMTWSIKAASTGNAKGEFMVGLFYFWGLGVSQDYEQAMDWYLKAANKGNADAMSQIGMLYQYGHGVTKNVPTAIGWYTKAANQGDPTAQCILGLFYETKDGFKDLQKAVNWYQKAADNGDDDAKDNVKRLNEKGYYAEEDKKDKQIDQVVDTDSMRTLTVEDTNQKTKEDLFNLKDRTQSIVDLMEEKYKIRIATLQKESDLHEQEKQQHSEENKKLRDEVAKLKALLQDNSINDIYYDSDGDKEDNKKDTGHDAEPNVIHQKKTAVDSESNVVDLNYDSDDHYLDPNYDSSDNEDLTKDLNLD